MNLNWKSFWSNGQNAHTLYSGNKENPCSRLKNVKVFCLFIRSYSFAFLIFILERERKREREHWRLACTWLCLCDSVCRRHHRYERIVSLRRARERERERNSRLPAWSAYKTKIYLFVSYAHTAPHHHQDNRPLSRFHGIRSDRSAASSLFFFFVSSSSFPHFINKISSDRCRCDCREQHNLNISHSGAVGPVAFEIARQLLYRFWFVYCF